jgi:hypothetical protein
MGGTNEKEACMPEPVNPNYFNPNCSLPYGLEIEHIRRSMEDFIHFLGVINSQLNSKGLPRIETFLMAASFSSIVGEFIASRIPKYCPNLVKNRYHNGHPDLIPKGMFSDDAVQYTNEGIEVKASRYTSGWQGHNPEPVWLMVFHFDSNTPGDASPKTFCFKGVYAAKLNKNDWSFSGRSEKSRRTITASVTREGVKKMKENWIYKASC